MQRIANYIEIQFTDIYLVDIFPLKFGILTNINTNIPCGDF